MPHDYSEVGLGGSVSVESDAAAWAKLAGFALGGLAALVLVVILIGRGCAWAGSAWGPDVSTLVLNAGPVDKLAEGDPVLAGTKRIGEVGAIRVRDNRIEAELRIATDDARGLTDRTEFRIEPNPDALPGRYRVAVVLQGGGTPLASGSAVRASAGASVWLPSTRLLIALAAGLLVAGVIAAKFLKSLAWLILCIALAAVVLAIAAASVVGRLWSATPAGTP